MSRYTITARAIASAAVALLVSACLVAPAFAGSKFQANIVPPPATYDTNNAVAPGIVAPAIPNNSLSDAVPSLAVCASTGGAPDNSCQGLCLSDVSSPTKGAVCSAVSCTTGGCNYACTGAPCSPLVCVDGVRVAQACTIPGLDPTECPGGSTVCNVSNVCYEGTPPVNNGMLCGSLGSACGTSGTCGDPGCGWGGVCVPVAAPDGPKASDTYSGTDQVDGQKSFCQVQGTQMMIKVAFKGTLPGDTPLAAKTGAGRCTGGAPLCSKVQSCTSKGKCNVDKTTSCTSAADCPNVCAKGLNINEDCTNEGECLCTKSADCGKDPITLLKGSCSDGNEYIGSVIGRMGVDPAACLGGAHNSCVLAAGTPGGGGSCVAGLCSGGSRDGAVCQVVSDCPGGGTCTGPGDGLALPTKVVGFDTAIAKVYPLCPFEFRIDQPMEVKSGKAQAKIDLAKSGLGVSLPAGMAADIVGCQVHEPGTTGISQLGVIVPAQPVAGSAGGRAIPKLTIPLTPGTTSSGGIAGTGLGPIIGITGAETP